MNFKMKYQITAKYLTPGSKRRSGKLIYPSVKFIVAHDTGNPNSTASANVRYYQNSRNEMSASAHIFVDDKEIIECIPVLTATPEKAWHVLYGVAQDNHLYGFNANDAAIGVEYCYGKNIDADEAYRKYLWVIACICHRFNLDPASTIVGHCFLDPHRKTDPVTGLAHSRRTYEQLLRDIVTEYNDCTDTAITRTTYNLEGEPGSVRTTVRLNIRRSVPKTTAPIIETIEPNVELQHVGFVADGESINGNGRWYKRDDGNYFWSGGVTPS